MILEWLQALTTPCPASWRKMGFLHQAIGINARQARHRSAWKSHTDYTKTFILKSAEQCDKHRKALLFGAATLHDLPVRELAQRFDEVILIDLFHLWQSRWLAATHNNINLEVCDLTNSLDDFWQGRTEVRNPEVWLNDDTVDFIVSANIASQLPLIPLDWLENAVKSVNRDVMGQAIIQAHFDYLKKFDARVCLVTDLERITCDETGTELERKSALFDLPVPDHQASWTWNIAPLGEIENSRQVSHIVIASNLGQNSD